MNGNFQNVKHDLEAESISGKNADVPGDGSIENSAIEGYDQADRSSNSDGSVDENKPATTQKAIDKISEQRNGDDDGKTKFFAIRITGGQERVVANMLHNKISTKKLQIYSVLVLDNFKGYIIVEAPDANVAYDALSGLRHVRGQIRGELPFKDIEGYLVKKPVVTDLSVDSMVEVVAGPFKSMKAKVIRVDYEKQEATVVLLDSPYQIPVTVDANYLRKLMQ
jgi:transcription termination/antitermination protein NusG